jgi:hypothetical protein
MHVLTMSTIRGSLGLGSLSSWRTPARTVQMFREGAHTPCDPYRQEFHDCERTGRGCKSTKLCHGCMDLHMWLIRGSSRSWITTKGNSKSLQFRNSSYIRIINLEYLFSNKGIARPCNGALLYITLVPTIHAHMPTYVPCLTHWHIWLCLMEVGNTLVLSPSTNNQICYRLQIT